MSCVQFDNISLKFRKNVGHSTGIKEAVLRLISPPAWKKKTQEFWGLQEVSFQVKEGDRVGIIGHNGAGKSTLLKVISRIYRPTLGKMQVEGRIAPLIEIGAGFNPELTGRENAYLNGAILGIPGKVISERMQSIIDFSELQEFVDMPVKYYSTGMHLRLAFALATEVIPDILILDELFAGGDHAFIKKANVRLEQVVKQSKILLLVAHNFEYIERFCNRVMVLEQGRIVFDGTVKEGIDFYLKRSKSNG